MTKEYTITNNWDMIPACVSDIQMTPTTKGSKSSWKTNQVGYKYKALLQYNIAEVCAEVRGGLVHIRINFSSYTPLLQHKGMDHDFQSDIDVWRKIALIIGTNYGLSKGFFLVSRVIMKTPRVNKTASNI